MRLGSLICSCAVGWLAGCASLNIDPAKSTQWQIPRQAQVTGVPFVDQSRDHCGPASLAMALGWAGAHVTESDLTAQTFTPGKEGTFQMDLIGAARRRGYLAIPVRNYESLFREVAAGHPVLILQNLGLSWWQKWHYSVVVGYDLSQSELTLHSGSNPNLKTGLKRFDLSWALADHWGLVLLPPGTLSASADEIAHLEAAAALERLELLKAASASYTKILERWPQSLGAWVGLGNVRFTEGDHNGSAYALEQATRFHPKSAAAWHNLAFAYQRTGQTKGARMAARQALKLVNKTELASFEESLSPLLGTSKRQPKVPRKTDSASKPIRPSHALTA